MSMKDLIGEVGFTPKRKEFEVEHKGKKLKFTAVEMSYLDSLDIAMAPYRGKNEFAIQISKTIFDQDGERMTYEQALNLPDQFAKTFLKNSTEVNKNEEPEKN